MQLDVLRFVIAILAVYRVSHMVALEDGPWDAFTELRERIGQRTWFGRGFHCVLCISWWLALPAAIAIVPREPAFWLLLWPAVAGGVLLLHKAGGYKE